MKVGENPFNRIIQEEPEWILDRAESGPWHWRRDTTNNKSRVRFRVDVEVKEFCRGEHEFDDIWQHHHHHHHPNLFTMSATCVLCIAITMVLPWYIFIGFN